MIKFALPVLLVSMLAACGEEEVAKKEEKYAIPGNDDRDSG